MIKITSVCQSVESATPQINQQQTNSNLTPERSEKDIYSYENYENESLRRSRSTNTGSESTIMLQCHCLVKVEYWQCYKEWISAQLTGIINNRYNMIALLFTPCNWLEGVLDRIFYGLRSA